MTGERRRLLAPEVVQTSAMDCGPACLASLVQGFGVRAGYERLREACRTEVDGTSVDTLEEVACALGLDAEQVLVPADHLALPEARLLPALAVVRQPGGLTHFVVVWRRHGSLVQIMDPAVGRRWVRADRLIADLYVHEATVPGEDWRSWAASEELALPLARRLGALGVGADEPWIARARADASPCGLATLDAATRLVALLVDARTVARGEPAAQALEALVTDPRAARAIPAACWSARVADSPGDVVARGAVLVRVRGRRPAPPAGAEPDAGGNGRPALGPELAAALSQPPRRPLRELLALLAGDGALAWVRLCLALGLASCGVVLEALVLRAALDVGRDLGLPAQRLGAAAAIGLFALALLLLELRVAARLAALGRRLETRLRLALLAKLPRLPDRYLQSRPVSDMAERAHSIHALRELPWLAGELARSVVGLAVTTAAIAWLDPPSAPLALVAAAAAVGLPLAFRAPLAEADLRVRTHAGALAGFQLDALRGLRPIRAHGAGRALGREHEALLVEWLRAGLRQVRAGVRLESAQMFVGHALAFLIVALHARRGGEGGAVLLLAYWALCLPYFGEQIARIARQVPLHRSKTLRLLEPLAAPEEAPAPRSADRPEAERRGGGVALELDDVRVVAGGHVLLDGVRARVPAGSHVAIVGASGAGKSTLVGLLLGWHRAAAGAVRVDGHALDGAELERLRERTVWIDPSAKLWNRSLADNLSYGELPGAPVDRAEALAFADLHGVLERLPDGLQTPIGEDGGVLSGGEGQRVRCGRAAGRAGARLVVLDEPFRGLETERRRALLARARELWRGATLLCVTHDIGDTTGFDRALVVADGRVVEDGAPADLAADGRSRYRALLDAERDVRAGVWNDAGWSRARVADGVLRREAAS